ncbi:MAG: TerB family tellurite resistance protein [Prevotellaceae bacterium]|nr:TerB family tellurite resistance protein [Prevotellaceae bacterium]
MILSDTEVHPKELETLYQIGKERGVSEEEIHKVLFSPNSFASSEELNNDERIEYLYNLARIAWADGVLDEREKATLQNASKRLGFVEENAEAIATFLLEQAHEGKPIEEVLTIIKTS